MSHEELQAISMAWAELCDSLSDEQFIAACKTHLRESRFFPCPADILTAHENTPPQYPAIAIPEHTSSPEEQHRSAVTAAMVFASMRGKDARAKVFFNLGTWEEKDAFARDVLGDEYPAPEQRRVVQ
jgi:hypothetical protein